MQYSLVQTSQNSTDRETDIEENDKKQTQIVINCVSCDVDIRFAVLIDQQTKCAYQRAVYRTHPHLNTN